jgi:hypothetical protein
LETFAVKSKTIHWDGRQVSKPGVYSNVPLSCYHAWNICIGPSISSSGLRSIYGENGSPKRFYSQWTGNPNRIIKPPARHFVTGRAVHSLILGDEPFAKIFCIHPDEWPDQHGVLKPWQSNRTTCKKWLAERAKEGRIVLTPKEVESIKQMAISLGNHPLVRHGGLNGAVERSYFWRDKETGVWLKWRPDSTPLDSADFVDIKTTRSIHWAALQHSIDQFGYYRQVSLGHEACRILLEQDMESFTLLFVEKGDPWDNRDVRVHDDDIRTGARENRAAIRTFAKCIAEKRWPGPGEGREGTETLQLSPRARERKDERLRYEGLADGED